MSATHLQDNLETDGILETRYECQKIKMKGL